MGGADEAVEALSRVRTDWQKADAVHDGELAAKDIADGLGDGVVGPDRQERFLGGVGGPGSAVQLNFRGRTEAGVNITVVSRGGPVVTGDSTGPRVPTWTTTTASPW